MSITPQERLRLSARLFTRPVFASLARTGATENLVSLLNQFDLKLEVRGQKVSDLFESAWRRLKVSYRSEYVYKNEIANRIIFELHGPRVAALHVELPVAKSIVDVAVFNGHSTAYEIKTEFDSTRRLETQTRDYAKAFEQVFVVTHPRLATKYADIVGPSVGVISLTKRGSLSIHKAGRKSADSLQRETMFRCLRRSEYLPALSERSTELRGLPNGVVAERCMLLFNSLPRDEAHSIYLQALRARSIQGFMPEFLEKLPKSLKALGCGTPLSMAHRRILLETLMKPLESCST